MAQPLQQTSHSHSRLIRFLTELSVADVETSHRDFAERLGLLFNFADSIILSDALKAQRTRPIESQESEVDSVRAECLRVQGNLVRAIVDGCCPGAETARLRWPVPKADTESITFEPYLRFYLAQQRDIDLALRGLRSHVRSAMKPVSSRLEQLVMLDIALEDTLWEHARRYFSVIPRFLEKRFDFLVNDYLHEASQAQPAEEPAMRMYSSDWLVQFGKDVQGLLLAELEVRLQPVLGLVEALENEVNNTQ